MKPGAKNAYHCAACGEYIVTVDLEDGVTPMFLGCRAMEDCPGRMVSMGYPKEPWPEVDLAGRAIPTEPAWEWYRPTARRLRRLDALNRQHVELGGLLLRPRESDGTES